ncbi:MAG: amidohydrolase family protein [Alphaproteobacteria bacterium]
MARTLIRGATVLTLDPTLGDFQRADILIDGDRIAAVAPTIGADDAKVVEAGGMIALPGFVDSHRHTWQALLRGTAADWTLAQYFAGVRGVMGRLYSPEDMYVANHLGALEALDSGITTLYDWSHNNNTPAHADGAVQGLKDSGIRGVYGYGNSNDEWIPNGNLPTNLADVTRVRRTHFPGDDGLVTMAFASRGPQFSSIDITEEEFNHVRDLGLRITMHVGDGLWGTSRPLLQMDARGLLGDDITFVHCNMLADEEIRLIADTGATASISPEVELQMGHGWLATMRLLEVGVRPSISIDIVTSIAGDMFGAMRMLLAGTRAVVNGRALDEKRIVDPLPLMSTDVLQFATVEGARACGLADKVGSLTPGKRADLILVDTNAINMFPMNNPYGAIVESANSGNVDSVWVDGVARKRNRRLLGVDLASLRTMVAAHREALFARAGVPADGTWLPKPFSEGADVADTASRGQGEFGRSA